MSLFKKKKNKVDTIYTGKATFYHNNGVSTLVEEGTFAASQLDWLKDHIGRDSTWQNKNCSVNLKYFYSIQFDLKEAE